KTAVSDILKMSLMEAQIDTNVEHMIVDPPKKALATSMLTGEAGALPSTHMVVAGMANSTPQQQKCRESCSSPSTVGSSLTTRKIDPPAVPATGQFMRIQNVGQKKAEESPAEIIIQVKTKELLSPGYPLEVVFYLPLSLQGYSSVCYSLSLQLQCGGGA
ncbi:EMSY isoform 9, partial [Pongo abelii]